MSKGFDGKKFVASIHHGPAKYDLPPYAPPQNSYAHHRSYGNPNLPFITYGFKPVASPYGNLTHPYPHAPYNRRYAKEIPDHVIDALEEMYARNNYKKREAVTEVKSRPKRSEVDEILPKNRTKISKPQKSSKSNVTKSEPGGGISEIRDSLLGTTFDLMAGLADLSSELIQRIRTTVMRNTKKPVPFTFVPLNSTKLMNNTQPNLNSKPPAPIKAATEQRRKVFNQASSLLRTVLSDFSKNVNRRLQQDNSKLPQPIPEKKPNL